MRSRAAASLIRKSFDILNAGFAVPTPKWPQKTHKCDQWLRKYVGHQFLRKSFWHCNWTPPCVNSHFASLDIFVSWTDRALQPINGVFYTFIRRKFIDDFDFHNSLDTKTSLFFIHIHACYRFFFNECFLKKDLLKIEIQLKKKKNDDAITSVVTSRE